MRRKRVTYNCMGEKSYEVYEVPKSDPSRAANHLPWKKSSKFSDKDSLSTTSGKSNSKITSKISHIVRRLSLHITSVPALLARLPDGILPYISPSTQLLQSWDASHSFWLQCSVTIRLCRHFLDLRASAQRRALYFLRLMSSQNHSDVPDFVLPSLSLHKMIYDFYAFKHGADNLKMTQQRIVVFLEACAQYCLSTSVVNIVKHALIPNAYEEDELTDNSIWVLIEARTMLYHGGMVFEGEEIQGSTQVFGLSSSDRLVEKRHVISKFSAESTTLAIFRSRGKFGPQFVNYIINAIETIPKVPCPKSVDQSNPSSECAADVYMDLDDFLLTLAMTYVHAERMRSQYERDVRQMYLKMMKSTPEKALVIEHSDTNTFIPFQSTAPKDCSQPNLLNARIIQDCPLHELFLSFLRVDVNRSGFVSKQIFRDLMLNYASKYDPYDLNDSLTSQGYSVVSGDETSLVSSLGVGEGNKAIDESIDGSKDQLTESTNKELPRAEYLLDKLMNVCTACEGGPSNSHKNVKHGNLISYVDFWAILINYYQGHMLDAHYSRGQQNIESNDQSDNVINDFYLTLPQMITAMKDFSIGLEQSQIESLMNYISTESASIYPTPLWLQTSDTNSYQIKRDGNWTFNYLPDDGNTSKPRPDHHQMVNGRAVLKDKESKYYESIDTISLTGTGNIMTRKGLTDTKPFHLLTFTPSIDLPTTVKHPQAVDSSPMILPSIREMYTVQGEMCKPLMTLPKLDEKEMIHSKSDNTGLGPLKSVKRRGSPTDRRFGLITPIDVSMKTSNALTDRPMSYSRTIASMRVSPIIDSSNSSHIRSKSKALVPIDDSLTVLGRSHGSMVDGSMSRKDSNHERSQSQQEELYRRFQSLQTNRSPDNEKDWTASRPLTDEIASHLDINDDIPALDESELGIDNSMNQNHEIRVSSAPSDENYQPMSQSHSTKQQTPIHLTQIDSTVTKSAKFSSRSRIGTGNGENRGSRVISRVGTASAIPSHEVVHLVEEAVQQHFRFVNYQELEHRDEVNNHYQELQQAQEQELQRQQELQGHVSINAPLPLNFTRRRGFIKDRKRFTKEFKIFQQVSRMKATNKVSVNKRKAKGAPLMALPKDERESGSSSGPSSGPDPTNQTDSTAKDTKEITSTIESNMSSNGMKKKAKRKQKKKRSRRSDNASDTSNEEVQQTIDSISLSDTTMSKYDSDYDDESVNEGTADDVATSIDNETIEVEEETPTVDTIASNESIANPVMNHLSPIILPPPLRRYTKLSQVIDEGISRKIESPVAPMPLLTPERRLSQVRLRKKLPGINFSVPRLFGSDIEYIAFQDTYFDGSYEDAVTKLSLDIPKGEDPMASTADRSQMASRAMEYDEDSFEDISHRLQRHQEHIVAENRKKLASTYSSYQQIGDQIYDLYRDFVPLFVRDYIEWTKYFQSEKEFMIKDLKRKLPKTNSTPTHRNAHDVDDLSDNSSLNTAISSKKSKIIPKHASLMAIAELEAEINEMLSQGSKRSSSNRIRLNPLLPDLVSKTQSHMSMSATLNPLKPLACGRVKEYSIASNSSVPFQIYIEDWPCVVTIEISCSCESIEALVGEDYVPSTNHYDYIHEIFASAVHPTQLTLRPKNRKSGAMYVLVRSFKQPATFKIWGYCSSPSTKYAGSDNIDKTMFLFDQLVATNDDVAKTRNAKVYSTAQKEMKQQSFNGIADEPWRQMSQEEEVVEDALVNMGLAALREVHSSKPHGLRRNMHEKLFNQ